MEDRADIDNDPRKVHFDGKDIATVIQLQEKLTAHPDPHQVGTFTVSGAVLKTFPQGIGAFSNITKLSLAGNQIEFLPWSVVLLKKLEHLDLSHNCINVIPPILCHFALLKTLDLSCNALEQLPTDMLNLVALEKINVSGNLNLRSPPLRLCLAGKEAIFEAFRNRQTREDAFLKWKPYYQVVSMRLKPLVELCIGCIIDSKTDFLSANIPPVMKTYLNTIEIQESSLLPTLMKCSKCERYFSKTYIFENHDCRLVSKQKSK